MGKSHKLSKKSDKNVDKKKLSKKAKIIILSIAGALLLGGQVCLLIVIINVGFTVKSFSDSVDHNYKDQFDYDAVKVCYGNFFSCEELKAKVDGEVKIDELGEYKLKYSFEKDGKNLSLNQTVNVKDLVGPVISVEDGNDLTVCPTGKPLSGKFSAIDNLDGDLSSELKFQVVDGNLVASAKDKTGNESKQSYQAKVVEDTEPPKITMNGGDTLTVIRGAEFTDPGVTVTDNCDDGLEATVEGAVNTATVGTYTITYKAKDSAGNEATAVRTVVVSAKAVSAPDTGTKVIYLTFDDGPSSYTMGLLDILKKYDVKVTFFVTGGAPGITIDDFNSIVGRAYREGHSIGLHTHSHTYSVVYSSDETFMDDLYWIQRQVKDATGGHVSYLMRFPGGSSNTVSRSYSRGIMSRLVNRVAEAGFYYFDWNVSSGDAGSASTADQVYNNVVGSLKANSSVVLQHDTKKFSIDAVERIIQYGLANGYTFKPLSSAAPGAHHPVNN